MLIKDFPYNPYKPIETIRCYHLFYFLLGTTTLSVLTFSIMTLSKQKNKKCDTQHKDSEHNDNQKSCQVFYAQCC
jgi:hypothetical protein